MEFFSQDGAKPPSYSTVQRIGEKPDAKKKAGKYYRGAVNAKPQSSKNIGTLGEVHKGRIHTKSKNN